MSNPNIIAVDEEGDPIDKDVLINGRLPTAGDSGFWKESNGELEPANHQPVNVPELSTDRVEARRQRAFSRRDSIPQSPHATPGRDWQPRQGLEHVAAHVANPRNTLSLTSTGTVVAASYHTPYAVGESYGPCYANVVGRVSVAASGDTADLTVRTSSSDMPNEKPYSHTKTINWTGVEKVATPMIEVTADRQVGQGSDHMNIVLARISSLSGQVDFEPGLTLHIWREG